MKHLVTLIKRKGLHVEKGNSDNVDLVHQINHELMNNGFILSKDLFDRLATKTTEELTAIMNELLKGINHVVGGSGYVATYLGFPQSVLAISYTEFLVNAILYYWTNQAWRPTETVGIEREFGFELAKMKELSLLEESQVNSVFTDIVYANNSISSFDKEIIDWFIQNGAEFNFKNIKFKEIAAYVGQRLLNETSVEKLPTNDATNVLRIWAAFSGGDEGLKTNTRFKNPTNRQKNVLLRTLEGCYNLEDSFKGNREMWLRLLFLLHPMVSKNAKRYPVLASFTSKLRNTPKELKTFNSKIEGLLDAKDASVFELLRKVPGVFTRRLDHLVRVFGATAFTKWVECAPPTKNLIQAYNHFTDRDKESEGRGAILASQAQSKVVTYKALEPLDSKLVETIKTGIINLLNNATSDTLGDKKVYIDLPLYYRPLDANNRASNMSLDGNVNGTVVKADVNKTIRLYVHWEGRDDIDLSAMLITSNNEVTKIGWNGRHHAGNGVVYSGDNTGHNAKNAEYIDITPSALPSNTEWIVLDANIYRGKRNFKAYNGTIKTGWMLRDRPEENDAWLPKTVANAQVLASEGKIAYLMAYHVPTKSIVYLDLTTDSSNVTTSEDALKMRIFLDKFVSLESDEDLSWEKINQGHLLHLLAGEVVDDVEVADIHFSELTTTEEVSKYL
tara:strand:+ start:158396 stop:160417 length:2022 start_codon:yes stop_codon:yes gene_type:complete